MHATGSVPQPVDPHAPRHGRPWRPRRAATAVAVVLAVAFLVNVAWRLWLVRNVTALTVRVDEDNYLLAARVLAGGPGGGSSENSLFRRIGYPLLISPVYWFSHDPLTTYRGVLAVGAVLNSLTLVPAYLFARRVLGLQRWPGVAAAIAVTALPAVTFYSQVAMTDAVLPLLVLCWLLAVHAAARAVGQRAQAGTAAVAGLLAGVVWLVHVRGLVVLGVQVVLIGWWYLRRRSWRGALAGLGGIAAVLAAELLIRVLIRGRISVYGGDPAGTLRHNVTSPSGWLHVSAWAVGQVWYQAVATLGLAGVGFLVALVWLRRRRVESRARDLTVLALVATTVGIAALSAATLPDDARINLYAYARYLAFLAPAWVLVAVAGLAEPVVAGRRLWRLGVAAAVLIAASGAVVIAYSQRLHSNAYIAFDSPEVGALTAVWDGLPVVRVSLIAVAALACLALLLGTRARLIGLAVLTVLGLAAMPTMAAHATRPMAASFAADTTLAQVGVTPADHVAEAGGVLWWVGANHQWEVWWQAIEGFPEGAAPPDDATVVVGPYDSPNKVADWDGTRFGWRLVHADAQGWAVWRRG